MAVKSTTTTLSNDSSLSLVCGMEIHAELKTNSKMFCGCKNDPFHAPAPNTYTCPVCLGLPGALPVANKKAIEWTIKLGLALHCEINLYSKFDRKNYFYPDLPKGYQISQYDLPFCKNGYITTSFGRVGITRIHLEEDTGKLIHKTIDGQKSSLIDFNRSSVPLIEIVTEPDIHSPEQAKEYSKKIRQLLRYLDIADCDMEQGGMRLEANVSLGKLGHELPPYKVEVKNINSFRYLEQAISFEMQRQGLLLMEGQTPAQETRGWDSVHNTTFPQRSKEDAEDYRYFPDPDIPPIHLTEEQLSQWQAELPEDVDDVLQRWENVFKVEPRFAELLIDKVEDVQWADTVFLAAQKAGIEPNKVASALVNKKISVSETHLPAEQVIKLYQQAFATENVASDELDKVIATVLSEQAEPLARYKAGQTQLFNFFLGQVMKSLGKKVDMSIVRAHLEKALQ